MKWNDYYTFKIQWNVVLLFVYNFIDNCTKYISIMSYDCNHFLLNSTLEKLVMKKYNSKTID